MNIHFSGIGWIWNSALARFYLNLNQWIITGSDSTKTDITENLIKEWVVWIDKNEEINSNTDLLIYSEAVPETDIQRQSAKKLGVKQMTYFEALWKVTSKFKTIAVCGTHGKSTTTSMMWITMKELGLDPFVIVWTKVREFDNKNIHISQNPNNEFFAVEACEYRESFLSLNPFCVVLINCEYDHADYYTDFEMYKNAYKKLVAKIPENGYLIANCDEESVKEIVKTAKCNVIEVYPSKTKNLISPKVPWVHNQHNAEMAKQTILNLFENINEEDLNKSLSNFSWTWRRFDILWEVNGIEVIDDYAHHPTEIMTTMKTLEKYSHGRKKFVVFQAHQYSRTLELFDDFIDSFKSLKNTNSVLYITDIYEVRDTEEDKQKVSAEKLVNAIKKTGVEVEFSWDYNQTLNKILKNISSWDLLFTMWAGHVNEVAERFIQLRIKN